MPTSALHKQLRIPKKDVLRRLFLRGDVGIAPYGGTFFQSPNYNF